MGGRDKAQDVEVDHKLTASAINLFRLRVEICFAALIRGNQNTQLDPKQRLID